MRRINQVIVGREQTKGLIDTGESQTKGREAINSVMNGKKCK